MKHKVSKLEGHLLDAAVAKAAGGAWPIKDGEDWRPSMYWHDGGPIIEDERIVVSPFPYETRQGMGAGWKAAKDILGITAGFTRSDTTPVLFFGPTPLIAAMRAFVASKLGDEVEL